jgi:hypothetical protein
MYQAAKVMAKKAGSKEEAFFFQTFTDQIEGAAEYEAGRKNTIKRQLDMTRVGKWSVIRLPDSREKS